MNIQENILKKIDNLIILDKDDKQLLKEKVKKLSYDKIIELDNRLNDIYDIIRKIIRQQIWNNNLERIINEIKWIE